MDLAQQYDQTLQETIGKSQRERNRALRQSQEQGTNQLSNVPGSNWSDRGVSGFRGAGFQDVANPTADASTRSFLGNAFGDYTEGGKQQAGFYGNINPYTEEGAYSLAQKGGYDYAPETLQSQFKAVDQTLPSIYGKSLANQNIRDVGLKIGDWQNQQKAAQDAYNTQKAEYDRQKAAYDSQVTAQQQAAAQREAQKSQLYNNIDWESVGGHDQTAQNRLKEEWSQYANAGFLPGQEKAGWKHNYQNRSILNNNPYGDMWKSGNTIIRYNPQSGYTKQVDRPRTGFLGGIFKALDPFLDKIDPLHNIVQKATTGESTTEGQMPYFQKIAPMIVDAFLPGVGSIVGGIDAGTRGDGKGVLGALAGYGLSTGLSGVDLTGMGNIANAAAAGAIKGGVSGAISGGTLQDAIKGAAAGGLGGSVSGGLGGTFNKAISSLGASPAVSSALGNFATGAGSNLASNLFKKDTQKGNLESALVSGLGRSLGGVYNSSTGVSDNKQRSMNLNTGTNLAKLFQQRKR